VLNVKKYIIFVLSVLINVCAVFAQTYPRGAILDVNVYNKLPQKAVQLSRSYSNLPKAYSLKQYAPPP